MRKRRILRFAVGVVSVFLCVGLTQSIVNHWQKRSIVEKRQLMLREEEARKQQLLQKLTEATTSAFIEREAREKLGLVKEGDTVVLVPAVSSEITDETAGGKGMPHWKKWWKLFF